MLLQMTSQTKDTCQLSIHNMSCFTYTRGFTLIETIVYLALFSIVIGGALAATTLLFEGAGRDTTRARLQEEGNFMLDKVAYEEMVPDTIYLQGLVDPSIVVSNNGVYAASSSNLGATIETIGVYFTLTTHTRQGRVVSEDFSATTTL